MNLLVLPSVLLPIAMSTAVGVVVLVFAKTTTAGSHMQLPADPSAPFTLWAHVVRPPEQFSINRFMRNTAKHFRQARAARLLAHRLLASGACSALVSGV